MFYSDNNGAIPTLWKEELESDPARATSANAYSWIVKGNITKQFLSKCRLTLNIGCGFGRELVHLPDLAIGIDIDISLLQIAKQLSKKEVICADAHCLPFRNEVFDGLALAEVIEHLSSPIRALFERHRVLVLHGKMVLQTPNKLVTLGFAISKKYRHVHEFTYSEIRGYLQKGGFTVVERTGSTIPYVPSTSRLEFLNQGLSFVLWKHINKHFRIITWDIIILGLKNKTQTKSF